METVPAPPSSPKYREPSAYCMSESNRPSQAKQGALSGYSWRILSLLSFATRTATGFPGSCSAFP